MKTVCVVLSLCIFSIKSFACSCIVVATPQNEYKQSDVVLTGKIIKKDTLSQVNSNDGKYRTTLYSWSILIERVYKGKLSSDTVKIISGIGDADCGFNFQIGENYIFYAYNGNSYGNISNGSNYLYTTICSRTRLKDSLEISALDKIKARKIFDY